MAKSVGDLIVKKGRMIRTLTGMPFFLFLFLFLLLFLPPPHSLLQWYFYFDLTLRLAFERE
ncbi:MAG TPA: hypothetical protein VK618_11665, partial [Flavitalea sp.]|nr:hypothetical protein [Flavitalea sp.]